MKQRTDNKKKKRNLTKVYGNYNYQGVAVPITKEQKLLLSGEFIYLFI